MQKGAVLVKKTIHCAPPPPPRPKVVAFHTGSDSCLTLPQLGYFPSQGAVVKLGW